MNSLHPDTPPVKANNSPLVCDWRLAELIEWQRQEQRPLPLPAYLIVQLEDRGYVVDLISGDVNPLLPLQLYIDQCDGGL